MTDKPHLQVEQEGALLVATLNRPSKLNAINDEMMQQFDHAVSRFRDDPALRVMLVRAKGRYFSAGADLLEHQPAPLLSGSAIREDHRRHTRGMTRIFDEMEAIEKPIVVAHQGPCLGGGLELSLSCDFRLANESARYGFPEGRFGVLPAANGLSRATRLLGPHWARYLIMANREIDSQRALMIGLVHEVFADTSFEADVFDFCQHLASQNPEHMAAAKLAIGMAADLGLAQARNVERMANSALMLAPSFWEDRALYLEHNVGGSKGRGG